MRPVRAIGAGEEWAYGLAGNHGRGVRSERSATARNGPTAWLRRWSIRLVRAIGDGEEWAYGLAGNHGSVNDEAFGSVKITGSRPVTS